MLTIGQVAARAGVSVSTVREWARKGLLNPVRTAGNQRRFREAEVGLLLSRNRRPQAAPASKLSDPASAPAPVPPWERRVKEAEADARILRVSHEKQRLQQAHEAAEASRAESSKKRDLRNKLEAVRRRGYEHASHRAYRASSAGLTAEEWRVISAEELSAYVTEERFPEYMDESEAVRLVTAHLDTMLEELIQEEGSERQTAKRVDELVSLGKLHVLLEVNTLGTSRLEQILRDEIDETWDRPDVIELVEDVLGEWEEEGKDYFL